MDETKICRICKAEKAIGDFATHGCSRGKGKYRETACRECLRPIRREQSRAIREARVAAEAHAASVRTCNVCRKEKPRDSFPVDRDKCKGREIARVAGTCHTCRRLAKSAYQQSQHGKAKRKLYRQTSEKEKARQSERTRKRRAYFLAWKKTPRGKLSAAMTEYRAALKATTDPEKAAIIREKMRAVESEVRRMKAAEDCSGKTRRTA